MEDIVDEYQFETKPTATFTRSAAKFYDLNEVLELSNRLENDPAVGKPLDVPTGAILGAPHPEIGRSSKGYKPVVIYCVNEPDRQIILIDVVEDISALEKWLADPKNVRTLSSYGKLIIRIVWEIFVGS